MSKNAFKDAFKAIDKLNEEAALMGDNSLSVVKEFVDSGSYALNAIMSGSVYGGYAKGRITGLVGPSGSGKTLMLARAIANAQKKDPQVWGVVWDSESAFDINMIRSFGGDPNRIKVCPVETVEACGIEIISLLTSIINTPELKGKVIIGIDSLGNLSSTKEMSDADKGKGATDMGTRAKEIKAMGRKLTTRCAKAEATIIFTNHIYSNPGQMFPSLVNEQAGGKGPIYISSTLVQFAVTQIKEEDGVEGGEIIPIANKVSGASLKALTVKNRFVPPFLETRLELNFKNGLYKYAGLLDMCMKYGIITKKENARTYDLYDGTNIGGEKIFKDNTELWEKKILPMLDEKLKANLRFSSEETDNLTQEVESLKDE